MNQNFTRLAFTDSTKNGISAVMRISLVSAALLAAGFGTAGAASFEAKLEALEASVEQQREALGVPGVAIAIVHGDQVVLARGFGWADEAKERPVTPGTTFAIGSTTKAFTATVVAMLVAEGKMTWDDPVTRHLPDFWLKVRSRDGGGEATIRDLLAHRTGFTRMGVLWAAGKASREAILNAAAQAEPWRPFRSGFNYCNVTYLAAGEAAGAASGMRWDDMVKRRILVPLAMENSATDFDTAMAHPELAQGFAPGTPPSAIAPRNIDSIAPAGSIYSDVRDLANWVRMQLARGVFEGRRIVAAEVLEETWEPLVEIGSGGMNYGLGWMVRENRGRRQVFHGGAIDGYGAQVGFFPDDGIGYVLLCNVTASPLAGWFSEEMARVFFDESEPPADGAGAQLGEAELEAYAGGYLADFGPFRKQHFEVAVVDGKLAVDVPGQTQYALRPPDSEGRWYFELTREIAVSFDREEGGAVTGMRLYQAGQEFRLPRAGLAKAEEGEEEARQGIDPAMEQLLEGWAIRERGAAFGRIRELRAEMTTALPNAGIRGRKTLTAGSGGQLEVAMDLGIFGREKLVLEGDKVELTSDFRAAHHFPDRYVAQIRLHDPGVLFGDWTEHFERVEKVREEEVDGRACVVVRLESAPAPPILVFVETASGDILRADIPLIDAALDLEIPSTYRFSDYREEDGVRLPWETEVESDASGRVVDRVTRLEVES